MKHVGRMSLHAAMDVVCKSVGYAIVMMIAAMGPMNRTVHQPHVTRKSNLPVLTIIV